MLYRLAEARRRATWVGRPRLPLSISQQLSLHSEGFQLDMNIRNCPYCGGTHFGSHKCPIEEVDETRRGSEEHAKACAGFRADATVRGMALLFTVGRGPSG